MIQFSSSYVSPYVCVGISGQTWGALEGLAQYVCVGIPLGFVSSHACALIRERVLIPFLFTQQMCMCFPIILGFLNTGLCVCLCVLFPP